MRGISRAQVLDVSHWHPMFLLVPHGVGGLFSTRTVVTDEQLMRAGPSLSVSMCHVEGGGTFQIIHTTSIKVW